MRVAVPIWRGCVSPLFEAARCLLLVKLSPDAELERVRIPLADLSPAARVQLLWLQGVEVLICGALSRPVQRMLHSNGIQVISWIRGEVEDVLGAYLKGGLDQPEYLLPGVRRRRRQRRRCGQTDRPKPKRGG